MKEKMIIKVYEDCGSFAENKDIARDYREKKVLPALKKSIPIEIICVEDASSDQRVVSLFPIEIDFDKVDSTTQSFVHAILNKALRKYGEHTLENIMFKNCSMPVKAIIGVVVNYSLDLDDE